MAVEFAAFGITVYAGHAISVISKFLIPMYNRREDEYGGSFENRARVQLELRLVLRDHRDHPGVVRSRAHFRKPHLVATYEELDAEHAAAAQVFRDTGGDFLRTQ